MKKAILSCFHKYTPYGDEFYEPILDYFMKQMAKYQDEFDCLYLLDSTWNIQTIKAEWGIAKVKVIKVNPSLRYYDAYKEVLPQIDADVILLMDNDMVIYKKGIIKRTFDLLQTFEYDVVSIYDTIGEKVFPALHGKSKFCPYWFATWKDNLMKYRDCDWGSNMPKYETLGQLTERMLADGMKPYEIEEDKSSIYFNGSYQYDDGKKKGKNLGYYHIRSGSLPAYLLATKKYGTYKTYEDYMVNQPRTEYLRQFAWYYLMTDSNKENWSLRPKIWELLKDIHITEFEWMDYYQKFKEYHGLI